MGKRALPREPVRWRYPTVLAGSASVACLLLVAALAPATTDAATVPSPLAGSGVPTGAPVSDVPEARAAAAASRHARAIRRPAAVRTAPGAVRAGRGIPATGRSVRTPDGRGRARTVEPETPEPTTPTPTTPPRTPTGGRPGPGNTGVPPGTELRRHDGDLVITKAGARYDRLDIHGFVVVKAPDVVITRSIIRGGRATGNIGLVTNTTPGATNFVLEDSELVPAHPSVWLDGIKGANYTIRRVEGHGTVDIAKVHGDNVHIYDSWLHDTRYYASDPNQRGGPTHNDAVQVLGGRNIRIVGNTVEGGSNAALQVTQDYSETTDLVFSRNWADGGMCTVNLAHKKRASMSGILVANNRFGRNTRVADCSVLATKGTDVSTSGNVWADDGTPVRIRRNG